MMIGYAIVSRSDATVAILLNLLTISDRAPAFSADEVAAGISRVMVGIGFALFVWWLVRRLPWPRPFRLRFALAHIALAPALGVAWYLAALLLLAVVTRQPIDVHSGRLSESAVIGSFFYAILAGASYAAEGTSRAARAEAIAARTQLAALRAQLHPHFLFNALHTVVQLIPTDPARAADAAELVADLLRSAVDEQRDEVTLEDEWRFVSRYLAIEQIRFGERLAVRTGIAPELFDEHVPSFALQTLVENAVVHGAAPRVAPTEIVVTAIGRASELVLSVRNSGDGRAAGTSVIDGAGGTNGAGTGTGLSRLRERLAVLYGEAARLSCHPLEDGGFEALLVVPRPRERA
jgi:two-component system, LytTR family, sensor kinase